MSNGSLLGGLSVAFSVDMSAVNSGIAAFKSSLSGVTSDVEQATAVFKGLEGAADGSRIISNVDVAEAQLTLLESKVQEARANLQELQNSADAGEAVTGIPEAEAQLTLLEAKAQEARANLQELQSAEETTGSAASGGFLSGIQAGIGGLGNFTSQLGMAFFAVQQLYQGAVSLAQGFLQPAETAETTTLSFTTLLHSTTAAKNEMVALNTYAAGTPMQTQWVDAAAAKVLSFGGTTKQVIPEITAIGDSLSGLGKLSEASLNSIVDIFGKISAQGKITGGDMMQLSDWGIPAWQALSTSMGKPIPELQKMVSAGLIPASTALPALEQGMENVFGGGMQKQANTFSGLMSTFASNWQIAMAAMGTPVLQALEPLLGKLGATLASPAFQQFATDTGTKIGADLVQMINGFTQLVSIGSQVVSFFQQNQAALTALEVVGVAVAGAVIASLVVGFYAWAVAAGTAAIATLAATWPILAIGAAIALVVAGIILAVQHWGAISTWLMGVWKGVQTFFAGLWAGIQGIFAGIGTWFGDRFNEAHTAVTNSFNQTKTTVTTIGQGIQQGWQNTVTGIVDAGKWLYDHNTYVKQATDYNVAVFNYGKQQISAAWTATVNWLTSAWQSFVTLNATIWNTIKSAISTAWAAISSVAMSAWTAISTWFAAQWNTFLTSVRTLWTNISNIFANIWNTYINPPLTSFINKWNSFWSGVVSGALNIGKNIMQAVANGISGAVGAVGNAIHGAISSALSSLGFHGLPGFASGVTNYVGGWAMVGERGPELMYVPQGASILPSGSLPMPSGSPLQGGMTGGSETPQTIQVYLDSSVIAQTVMTTAMKRVRIKTGMKV